MALATGFGYGTTTLSSSSWTYYGSTTTVWINTKGQVLPAPKLKLETARPLDWLRQEMKPWLEKKVDYRPTVITSLRKELKPWLAAVKL